MGQVSLNVLMAQTDKHNTNNSCSAGI